MKKITFLLAVFLAFMLEGKAQLLTQDFNTALTWTVGHPTGTSTNAGWTRETSGSNPTATPFGSGLARFNSFSINVTNTYDLNSPAIAFAGGAYRVTFKMFRENGYIDPLKLDKIDVYFNATAATSVGGTLLGTVNRAITASPIVSANGWYTYSFIIPGTPTGPGYISFLATTDFGNNMYIDDVVVELQPTCLPPTAILSSVSTNAATLSFTASTSAPANGYQYELRTSGAAGSGATGLVTSGSGTTVSYVLGSLTPNTAYTFYVKSICSGTDTSAWESKTFTTLAIAPVNDSCFGAVTLTTNASLTCTATVAGTLLGATASGEATTSIGTPDDDVWYKFVATSERHRIVLSGITPATDLVHEVLAGDCGGGLYNISISDPDTSNLSELSIGDTYYVRVFSKAAASNSTANFTICIGTPPPPPANDNCAGAVLLTPSVNATCTSTTDGTTVDATQSLPGCTGNADDDVWYKFVATSNAHSIITTNVSGETDIVTEVFDACGGTSLKCQDSPNSPVALTGLTIGNTYFFRIFSYYASPTTFRVCIGTQPLAPANDLIANAVALTLSTDTACNNSVAGTTVSASHSAEYACSTTDADVWYTFTPATTAGYVFKRTVTTGTGNGYISVYSGAPSSLTRLNANCTSASVVQVLTAGTTYYVSVSSSTTATLSFALCVFTAPPAPVNDNCDGAITLTVNPNYNCGAVTPGSNAYSTLSPQATTSLAGTVNNDVWFKFVATAVSHRISLSNVVAVVGTSVDMAMGLYDATGGCDALVFKSTSDPDSYDAAGLVAGTTYYLRVYGFGATSLAQANFNVCIGTQPPAPANDLIANAAVLTESTDTACNNALAGTTAWATHSAEYACSTTDVDVWYTFTPSATASYVFRRAAVTGTGNGYISIYSGTPAALARLNTSCTSASVVQVLTAGTTYYVSVSSTSTSSLGFALCAFQAPPAPANDNCDGAITLTVNPDYNCGAVTPGSNAYSTLSPQATTSLSGTVNNDVWFKFVATAVSHRISLSNVVAVVGTSVDMAMGLYDATGGCDALVFKSTSDPDSYDAAGLVAGTTYYLRVYGWGGATTLAQANFNVCIGTQPPAPANNLIANAAVLTESTDTTCNNALAGTTAWATHSAEYACSTTDVDVWYTFTPSATAGYVFRRAAVTGTGNGYISIYSGTPAALVRLNASCSTTTFVQALTAGTTYYVSVSSTSTSTLGFALCAFQAPPAPANDNCDGAITLTVNPDYNCGAVTPGSNAYSTLSPQATTSLSGTVNNDVWFKFVATAVSHRISLSNVVAVIGTSVDMGMGLYDATGGCDALVFKSTSDPDSYDAAGLVAGTTYYLRVYGWGAATLAQANFNVCIGTLPNPPANDLIASAAVLTESPNNSCANALLGSTYSATHSAENDCNATAIDVWYTFTPTATNNYIFGRTVISGTGNGYISIYSGTPAALVRLNTSCSVTSLTQALTAGTTYYVSVTSTLASQLSFRLCTYPAPPPPANDSCSVPTALTAGADFASGAIVTTNAAATREASIANPSCGDSDFTNTGKDVWYSVAAPASGTLTLETGAQTGSLLLDTAMQVFRGTCDALVSINCNDDITAGTNIFSKSSLTGLTAGEVLLVRVWSYGTTPEGAFKLSAYDASLSAPTFDNASFKAYPNPVKDVLKLSYSQDMTNLSVFNLVGQEVISKSLNASEAQVDMSNLAAGTYLVKVIVDNQVKTIKVVKQ